MHIFVNFEERMQRVQQKLEGIHSVVADTSVMKLGKLDGDIRSSELVRLKGSRLELSCTIVGPTFYSDQSQRDCACWM